jgi:hypothetical protein
MTSKLNAKYKDNNNTNNTSNNRNSRKSNLNHKNTSFLKSNTPSSNNSKFTTKLNETQTTTTKYNRVILNSFRLPDSSEYDDENTEEADTSASIHFNSDFASFSSNEYNNNNNNNNHITENLSPRKENYIADNNSRNTTRRRVSCPVSTHGNCSNNHQHNYYHQVDDFRFLKFDPFDRVVSRLSGRKN